MFILYAIVLLFFSIYSYSLIDVNLTLLNNKYWATFRNIMVDFGYLHRDQSAIIFILFLILLFIFNWYFVSRHKKINILALTLITGGALFFSYPFLSHDFFSYIFDAKIVTFYHQNPYLMRPQDFPGDQWLRFLHWTHRTYPYGPTFLITTLIPSFIAGGKFILNYFLFKLMFVVFYFLGVWSLRKLNKKWAIIFATHPLVLIEGLINAHNDLVAVSFALLGIYALLTHKNAFISRLLMVYSAGIKYITTPFLFLTKKYALINQMVIYLFIGLMTYLSTTREIQSWYFLSFFALLPFAEKALLQFNLLTFGLMAVNYLYIRYGATNVEYQLTIKNIILYLAFITNGFLVFWKMYIKKIPTKFHRYGFLFILVIFGSVMRFIELPKTILLTIDQIKTLSLFDFFSLNLRIIILPVLFTLSMFFILLIKNLSFWSKVFFLLITIFSDFSLFYSRTLSIDGIIGIILLLIIQLSIFSFQYIKRNKSVILIITLIALFFSFYRVDLPGIFIRGFFIDALLLGYFFDLIGRKNEIFKKLILLIFVAIAFIGPVRYFYKDYGLNTLHYQQRIAGAIIEYKKTWEHNQLLNKKKFDKTNQVNIKIYPDKNNLTGLTYVLKESDVVVSDNGIPFIICYNDVCKKEYYMEGILKKGNLILPGGEKVSFDQAIIIYEIPGKIEVYGFR